MFSWDNIPDKLINATDDLYNLLMDDKPNEDFQQLLANLDEKSKQGSAMTKTEVDWLVEELSKIDSFTTKVVYNDLAVEAEIQRDRTTKVNSHDSEATFNRLS